MQQRKPEVNLTVKHAYAPNDLQNHESKDHLPESLGQQVIDFKAFIKSKAGQSQNKKSPYSMKKMKRNGTMKWWNPLPEA